MVTKPALSELPADSIRVSTQPRKVRLDDATEEVEQAYLNIEGTPAGFRWLAMHLQSMADSAEQGNNSCGNIVAAWDFQNRPIQLADWDSLEFHCDPSV